MASSLSWSSSSSRNRSPDPSQPSASPTPSLSSSSSSSQSSPAPQKLSRQPLSRIRPTVGPTSRRRPTTAESSRATRESPEQVASTLSAQNILDLRIRYSFPPHLQLFYPSPKDRVTSTRPGRVALYGAFFKAGLRLPLHPFIINLLDRYSLTLSQLVPNSIRTIVSFLVLCHLQGIEASLSLFRSFYTLRQRSGWWSFTPRPTRTLKLYLPTSVKGWKDKFFFANVDGVKGIWEVPNTDANRDSSILPKDKLAFGQLITAEIPRCSRLLSEEYLRRAGLIPSNGEYLITHPYSSFLLFYSFIIYPFFPSIQKWRLQFRISGVPFPRKERHGKGKPLQKGKLLRKFLKGPISGGPLPLGP